MSAAASHVYRAAFEIGLKLMANLLEAAKEHRQSGQLSATFRGRDVPQIPFVAPFLDRARSDAAIYDGFVSGLSGYLAAWAEGHQLSAEDLRQATWAEVHAGANTIYYDEVPPKIQPAGPVASGGAAAAPEVAEASSDATSWRTKVSDSLQSVQDLLSAAVNMEADTVRNAPFALQLVCCAQRLLDQHAEELCSGDPDVYYGECILAVQANLVGARHMPDAGLAFKALLEVACLHLQTIERILDAASVEPPAPPLPPHAGSEQLDAAFSEGVKLFAKAVNDLHSSEASAHEAEARFRPAGVRQNTTAVKRALLRVQEEPALAEGFICAMTCYLGELGPRGGGILEESYIASLQRENCGVGTGEDLLGEEALPAPSTSVADFVQQNPLLVDNFMEGKGLCAEMVERAIEVAQTDEAELEARFRGRGVPQNNFARSFLEEVMRRPEVLEGFSAALSNTLSVAGAGNNNPDVMRGVTYEGYIGGPDTKYMAEEDDAVPTIPSPDATNEAASAESAVPDDDRVKVATAAAQFISRMSAYFRASFADVQQRDWAAIHEAASVVMSMDDPVEDAATLEQRLAHAINSASVIFEEQPPTHWREDRILRQEDVGKRLVSASA